MQDVHMSLDRSHLQLLVALAEHGRLGDAARALHLSPSAASHRMAEAERRVGTALTAQRGRTIELTDAGRHLSVVAVDVERELDRAELAARWIGAGDPARIRVAVGFYDTASWLVDTFAPVAGRPRTELLRVTDRDLLDAVRRGQCDLAVAPWPRAPTGLRNLALHDDELVAAVPVRDPLAHESEVTPEALYEHTFLTSTYEPARGFEFHEFFLPSGFVPRTVIQVQSLEMMLRLVGRGLGVTIQPSLVLTWNRPHRDVEIVPLAGRPIRVRWTATHAPDASDLVGEAASRIAEAFARAAARGEGAPPT